MNIETQVGVAILTASCAALLVLRWRGGCRVRKLTVVETLLVAACAFAAAETLMVTYSAVKDLTLITLAVANAGRRAEEN